MQKTVRIPAHSAASATSASPVGCSAFKVRQLSRRVSQHFDQIVSSTGLKTTQYSLLSHVVRLGPLKPGELAAEMEMDASTLTRNLQPLVAQGWVEVGPGADGRSRLVSPTEAGREKYADAKREWKRAQLAFNQRMGDERVIRLHALIEDCLDALNADTAP